MEHEQPVQNLEIPATIDEKRALARRCIEIVQDGGDIPEGLTPRHIGQEAMVGLIQMRNRRSQKERA